MFAINELFCYFPNPLEKERDRQTERERRGGGRESPSAKFIDYGHHVKVNKKIYFIKTESNEELFMERTFFE